MSKHKSNPVRNISLSERRREIREKCEFNVEVVVQCARIGYLLEWDKWSGRIPFIKFDQEWSVRIIPPSHGAMVRFHVNNQADCRVSVYLDCHDILGSLGFILQDDPKPYWEIYPYEGEDIHRVAMDDVEGLLEAIRHSFKYQESQEKNKEDMEIK